MNHHHSKWRKTRRRKYTGGTLPLDKNTISTIMADAEKCMKDTAAYTRKTLSEKYIIKANCISNQYLQPNNVSPNINALYTYLFYINTALQQNNKPKNNITSTKIITPTNIISQKIYNTINSFINIIRNNYESNMLYKSISEHDQYKQTNESFNYINQNTNYGRKIKDKQAERKAILAEEAEPVAEEAEPVAEEAEPVAEAEENIKNTRYKCDQMHLKVFNVVDEYDLPDDPIYKLVALSYALMYANMVGTEQIQYYNRQTKRASELAQAYYELAA